MNKKEFCIMPKNSHYSTERSALYCHRHEVFGASNRQRSIREGLVVFLQPEMHNMSEKGVHSNRAFDLYLKCIAERAWCEHYGKTIDDFIKAYGKNYIDNVDLCVSCGAVIPEGRMICYKCERWVKVCR
jgi:hypothetical protein